MMLDLDLDSGHVKKLLVNKHSGKAVGVAFLKTEESNLGLEDLVWTYDNKEESLLVGRSLVLDPNEVEEKRNDMETDERQGSVEQDDSLEEEMEQGNETGGSLIYKGVKFTSVCDFLSFMNEDETATEKKGKVSEREGERLSLYPVVKLKRLSLKDGFFEPNSSNGDLRVKAGHVKTKAVWLPSLLSCLQPQLGKEAKKKSGGVSLSDVSAGVNDKHISRGSDKYHCQLCDYSSKHRFNVKKHVEGTHRLGLGWDCEKCGRHFKHQDSFNQHTRKTKCAKMT